MTEKQLITLRNSFRDKGISQRKVDDVLLLLYYKLSKNCFDIHDYLKKIK